MDEREILSESEGGQLVMGIQPNATSNPNYAKQWREIDFEVAEKRVKKLQERIVQAMFFNDHIAGSW